MLHFALYFNQVYDSLHTFINATGLGALSCLVLIFVTSTNSIRRNHFNLFYWAHYSFAAFFPLVYAHASQSRPYILAGIAVYAMDKIGRLLWSIFPRHTLDFRVVSEGICVVRLPKSRMSPVLGKHKLGQYMFVNFTELGWSEWHPFSVSSGPREEFIELHIKALGDHTKAIVELAAKCEHESRQSRIRVNGPCVSILSSTPALAAVSGPPSAL